MFHVTIEHPGISDEPYVCDSPAQLRTLVWGVARAQGKPITDKDDQDREMIIEVGHLWSRAVIERVGLLDVHDLRVKVEPVEDEFAYACEGHEGEDSVLLGGPTHCDGTCRPRRRFDHKALVDLSCALDDADVEAAGGCGRCSLEADQMCADCGRCNCHTHATCERPVGK
ncbi:hypothetical protein ABZ923_40120 [Streptomyces sp. NPDC046881]|uniref:hypothetical protein n=1 Tax=Streptomyces sp. NPDC046881 TaxID=3155374 RepID=UPI0033FA1355